VSEKIEHFTSSPTLFFFDNSPRPTAEGNLTHRLPVPHEGKLHRMKRALRSMDSICSTVVRWPFLDVKRREMFVQGGLRNGGLLGGSLLSLYPSF